jgi:UDP-N-acetyl-D-mannosaminuronic acid dehydrogenase
VIDPRRARGFDHDAVVVGGCGRVGLPLAVALADRGARVAIYDIGQASVAAVNSGPPPFFEPGAAQPLQRWPRSAAASGDPGVSVIMPALAEGEHIVPVLDRFCFGPRLTLPQVRVRAAGKGS